jgi:hypothetical protein
MLAPLAFAGFMLAHALIHVAFIVPPPPAVAGGPRWPFATTDSWCFTRLGFRPSTARLIAAGLVATTITGFLVGALSVIGILPTTTWLPGIAVGAFASLGLLVACFHPSLVLGVGIDLVLLWAALVTGWSPAGSEMQIQ